MLLWPRNSEFSRYRAPLQPKPNAVSFCINCHQDCHQPSEPKYSRSRDSIQVLE
jgi:hypothetical protein